MVPYDIVNEVGEHEVGETEDDNSWESFQVDALVGNLALLVEESSFFDKHQVIRGLVVRFAFELALHSLVGPRH